MSFRLGLGLGAKVIPLDHSIRNEARGDESSGMLAYDMA